MTKFKKIHVSKKAEMTVHEDIVAKLEGKYYGR